MIAACAVPAMGFFARWIWPGEGLGGAVGDVLGTGICVFIGSLVWPPTRRAVLACFGIRLGVKVMVKEMDTKHQERHIELHSCLDEVQRAVHHIIKHDPVIPDLEESPRDGPPAA